MGAVRRSVVGGTAAVAVALGAGIVLLSDEQGAPVPFELQGADCLRYGDALAACSDARGGTRYFARDGDAWIPPTRCEPRGRDRVRCRSPYVLELDFTGPYPALRRAG